MVPDDGGRAEGELVSTPEQPPAAVDIIARDAELRIEAAYQLERPPSKRHVADRDVLSHRRLPHGHRACPRRRTGTAARAGLA